MANPMIWLPSHIESLGVYVPGKNLQQLQKQKGRKMIKLASNENPWGLPEEVKNQVAREVAPLLEDPDFVGRYPEPQPSLLRESIAQACNVSPDEVFIANGSDECFDLIVRLVTLSGFDNTVLIPEKAFQSYELSCQLHNVPVLRSRLLPDGRVDVDHFLETFKKNPNIRLIFMANPNNPTGGFLRPNEIEFLLTHMLAIRDDWVCVLDEAYAEYIEWLGEPYKSGMEWVRSGSKNVVVTRTFSKIFGLAAFRMGYLIGHSFWVQSLNRVRKPFSVNSFGAKLATIAHENRAAFKFVAHETFRLRLELTEFLEKKGTKFWGSPANFVTIFFSKPAKQVAEAFEQEGVIIRPLDNYGLSQACRVSIGTFQQMQAFYQAWHQVDQKGGL